MCSKCLEDLNLTAGVYEVIKFLVKDENDFNNFLKHFWLGENRQVISVSNYRQHKILQRNLMFEEFLNLYYENPVKGLGELFMHPVYDVDVDKLEQETVAGRMSLEKLYNLHKDKPLRKLGYFLLRRV